MNILTFKPVAILNCMHDGVDGCADLCNNALIRYQSNLHRFCLMAQKSILTVPPVRLKPDWCGGFGGVTCTTFPVHKRNNDDSGADN